MITNLNMENNQIGLIQNILDAIEGEKDPRNILLMFKLVCNLNNSIPDNLKKVYSKNFFDILEVYYPIEFVPPKNSPDKITPEDLSDQLNESFASNIFYLEYLNELLKDKISSTLNETKIQVFKTIKKLNEKLPQKAFNHQLITFLNLLLQQILNNEDEYVHVEALITFKEIIKKFCEDVKDKIYESLDQQELHIIKNIQNIFEKSEDFLFNAENSKNSFDAKDILIILVEYADIHNLNFREIAFKLCMKLINTYINTNKISFLKNANALLFFVTKQDSNTCCQMLVRLEEYIKVNKSQIKNTIINLFKKISISNDSLETTIDITTCFIVKVGLFEDLEVVEYFGKIFTHWKECEASIEKHLGICLNEIIVKYPSLDNTDFIFKFIDCQIRESLRNEGYTQSDIIKYSSLLMCYFSNVRLSYSILEFILNIYSEVFYAYCRSKANNLENILVKFSEIIETIVENNKVEVQVELLIKFCLRIIDNKFPIPKFIYKSIKQIFKSIVNLLFTQKNNSYEVVLEHILNLVPENSTVLFHLKIINYILAQKIQVPSDNKINKINQILEKIYSYLNNIFQNENNDKQIIEKVSINLGLIYYLVKSDSLNKEESLSLAFSNNLAKNIKTLQSLNETNFCIKTFTKYFTYCSTLINYTTFFTNFESFTGDLLNIFHNLHSDSILTIVENSRMFVFDEFLKISKSQTDKLLSILKNSKFTNPLGKNIASCLLANIYSSFTDEELDDNVDIILNLCIKSFETNVNVRKASVLMKKMLKYVDRDFSRKRGYEVNPIILNMLNVVQSQDDIQVKMDLLSCLYKFKMVLPNLDAKITNVVVKQLKPLLNYKKRIIRKFCGMVINIWIMNE